MPKKNFRLTNEDAQEILWQIIRKIDYCMFTTRTAVGAMRSRPMSTIVNDQWNEIILLSDKNGGKDEEIKNDPEVLLSYSNGSSAFASVRGRAVISTDRQLIRDVWSAGAQAFWPEGPDDPSVFAIIVTPGECEYWDGNSGLLAGIKFAYAIATGGKPDLGENRKVSM